LKVLLLKELQQSERPDQFWLDVFAFAGEQTSSYINSAKKMGLELGVLQPPGAPTIEEEVKKKLQDIIPIISMLAKVDAKVSNYYRTCDNLKQQTAVLKKELGTKEQRIEELGRELTNAGEYAEEQKKAVRAAQAKVLQDITNRTDLVRNHLRAIVSLTNQAEDASPEVAKMLPEKVSEAAMEVVRILGDNGLWPEEETKPVAKEPIAKTTKSRIRKTVQEPEPVQTALPLFEEQHTEPIDTPETKEPRISEDIPAEAEQSDRSKAEDEPQ